MAGVGAVILVGAGAGIFLELEPELDISKMGGSGNPDYKYPVPYRNIGLFLSCRLDNKKTGFVFQSPNPAGERVCRSKVRNTSCCSLPDKGDHFIPNLKINYR